ncbi:hypothetical protein L7F22_011195 [Adiantum nelumboides]|nr:hypothetical protein [Adiantum nelumboides]
MAETPQEERICCDSARTPHICSTKWVDSKVEVEGEDTGFARIQCLQWVLCRNFGLINLKELDKNYERDMYLASGQVETVLVRDWSADLRTLSAGAALVALTLWLDQMQDAALQGFPEPPKTVMLVTGGKGCTSHNETSVEQTVKVHLWTMGSPFLRSVTPGKFVSKGYSFCHWVKDSPHCMDLKLRNFAVLPEFNTMEVHNGAFMPTRLVAGLQQIEQSVGELRPKKFRKVIHLTEMQRADVIAAELKAKEEMMRKGLLDNKGRRKAWVKRKLRKKWRQQHA